MQKSPIPLSKQYFYHRISPSCHLRVDPNYVAASTTKDNLTFFKFPEESPTQMYCLENTFDNYSNNYLAATHLLVGAQIKIGDKTETIFQYLGQKYTKTGLTNLMSTNANVAKYFVKDDNGTTIGSEKYISFKPEFFELNAKGSTSYTINPHCSSFQSKR